jgi:hypothetical protein
MIRTIGTIGLALGVALAGASASAAEYNKRPHLPPSAQVKVNNVRAKILVVQDQVKREAEGANEQADFCNDPDSGVVVDRTNPRSEVIIATQDIVNLGGQLDLRAGCQ